MKKTRVCDLLDIDYPIILAAMGWICGPRLTAAVSNAGGLGTLGINAGLKKPILDPDEAKEHHREQIRRTKLLTSRPFALSIVTGKVEHQTYTQKLVELAIEEEVPVAIVAGGSPKIHTSELQRGGVKVLHAVSSVAQAQGAEAAGVNAVITEGYEGGGQSGLEQLPTFILVPQVADAVEIPVIAGGGIADARGYVAALALGAEGVYVGTRFIATDECDAHPNVKQAVIAARDSSTVSLPSGVGMLRSLRNEYTDRYEALLRKGAPQDEWKRLQNVTDGSGTVISRFVAGLVNGDLVGGWLACGAVAGMISEIVSAEAVIQSIVEKVPEVIRKSFEVH